MKIFKKVFLLTDLVSHKIVRVGPRDLDSFYEEQRHRYVKSVKAKFPDDIALVGSLLLKVFDRNGSLRRAAIHANLVTSAGKDAVIDRLQAASVAVHDYMAIGTGSTAANVADTTLQTETGTRVQGALTQPTSTTDRLISTFAAGNGTAAITETGRLNASSSGNLFCRSVFSAINKGASDSLAITYDITVS